MSQPLEYSMVKYTIFDRKQLQRNKLQHDYRYLERKDIFDIQKEQLKLFSNVASIDRGIASRLTPTTPLVWKSLLPKNFIVDAFGNQQVHKMNDILANVDSTTWVNIPMNGEILVKKYIDAIINNKKRLANKSTTSNPIPIVTSESADTKIADIETTEQKSDVVDSTTNVEKQIKL